tara:strand:+ start:733 stop:1152 length:420 start_codon:yes stop_codon:yes gene_type:complete
MGNRAVIAIKQKNIEIANTPCIYLHWNGGRDSVEGFLETHHKLGMRGAEDATYALARLTQIIANAIGGELSVGVGIYSQLDTDNYDNGVYWLDNVDGKLQIVEREYEPAQEQQNYDIEEFSNSCIETMPESYQPTKKGA